MYRAERAISPVDGSVSWVVVDHSTYELHREASSYIDSLRARSLSWNTERLYASRSALYLTACSASGVDWSRPSLGQLARFMRRLVQEPLPSRRRDGGGKVRFRSEKTANAVMTTVCELLRFGARYGWVPQDVANQLTQQKYLAYLPPGYNAGEDGQFRTVRARELKFIAVDDGIDWLTFEDVEQLLAVTVHARDRFWWRCCGARPCVSGRPWASVGRTCTSCPTPVPWGARWRVLTSMSGDGSTRTELGRSRGIPERCR